MPPGNAMAHISGWPTHGVDNAGPILANQAMVDHHAPVPKDKVGLIDEFIIGFCEELPPDNTNRFTNQPKLELVFDFANLFLNPHSHSMVPGGFEVTS